jgi:hypothetical protein
MNQEAERVTLSHGILSVLSSVRSTGFQSVIIGDESCSFCTIFVIRHGHYHAMKYQKESVRKLKE